MVDASWPVQQAVYDTLKAALHPVKIYDHVPQRVACPFVTIGESTIVPAGDKIQDGQDITLTVHSWSESRGQKEAKQLQAKIKNTLDNGVLQVTGFSLRSVRQIFATVFKDADSMTYHGVQRFRIVVDEV